jgi:hypothetical protein
LAIQIAAHFRFAEDWYRAGPVLGLVLAYYTVLRSVLRAQPALRQCRTRCRHCGIFFLTHPRNAGRRDLRCPFGCRQAHRRHESNQRSKVYYQEEEGKKKKQALNAQRRKTTACPPPPPPARRFELPSAWPRPMLPYLQMVIRLIEGRPVSRAEVVAMLRRALRQHRMVKQHRLDQDIAWLHGIPP